MKCFLAALLVLVSLTGVWGEESALWIVGQDFVKFGKKDVYEKQIKTWYQAYGQFTAGKEPPPVIAFQDYESPQYLYFIPVANYGSLDGFFNMEGAFRETLIAQNLMQIQNTTLNFYIRSIHSYLPECSHVLASLEEMPFVHYFSYAIIPGGEEVFEGHLRKLAAEQKELSNISWRTWKVVFDSDVPKYVIYLFAKKEEDLEHQVHTIQFIEPSSKEILRRERGGRARLRTDLSFKSKNSKLGTGPGITGDR